MSWNAVVTAVTLAIGKAGKIAYFSHIARAARAQRTVRPNLRRVVVLGLGNEKGEEGALRALRLKRRGGPSGGADDDRANCFRPPPGVQVVCWWPRPRNTP